MSTCRKLLLLCLFLWLPLHAQAADYELEVDGLACSFCVYGLEKKLNKLESVTSAEVSLKHKMARITTSGDAELDESVVRQSVIDAGFTPGELRKRGPE